MTVELYHFPSSLCSQKARLVLAEKGVDWNSRIVNLLKGDNLDPGYMALNPAGVVPTLVHDGTPVTNSLNILRYVDKAFEGPDLAQGDPGLIEAWLKLQDVLPIRTLTYGVMPGRRGRVMRSTIGPKRKLAAKALRRNPGLKEAYEAKIRDLDRWLVTLGSPQEIKDAIGQVDRVLDQLEATLAKQRWLAGDDYSLADLAWTPVLARFEMLGFAEKWRNGRREHVDRYFEQLKQRRSYAVAITEPAQEMPRYFRDLWWSRHGGTIAAAVLSFGILAAMLFFWGGLVQTLGSV